MRQMCRVFLLLFPLVLTAALTLPVRAWAQRACTPAFNFEDGTLEGFTVQSVFGVALWHNDNNLCRADLLGHSTPHTLYYGQDLTCNFNTGARNASNAFSPAMITTVFNPPITLEFNYLLFVEGGGFDTTFGDVSVDGGGTWTQVFSKSDLVNDNEWHNLVVDITSLVAGTTPIANKPTNVRFRFDSIDNIANSTTGWHIDDVQLCGTATAIPTLSPLGMAILMLLLAGASVYLLRQRREAGA